MAKNYSIAEAVQIIAENADTASITDLGKRYPLLTNMIARVAVLAGDEFVAFASYLPEHVSANKVNKAIKDAEDAAEADEDEDVEADDDEEEVEEEAPKKPAKKAEKPEKKAPAKKAKKEEPEDDDEEDGDSSDYDNMSNKELWGLLGEVGGRKKCREEFGDTKTADMIKYFKKYYPNGVDAEQPEEAEEEPETDEYTGKSAVELYKMCKTRKIKAEQKKPAKYYIELLKKADAEAAKSKKKADDDDEEWDDDEAEEEPAPKKQKKEAKAEKKPAKKAAKEETEDDDDDWEI